MLGEQLKDFRDSNRAHLEIENKRLQDNLQNQKTEHEQNQKWLKSQNDTLMRKQQVNHCSRSVVRPGLRSVDLGTHTSSGTGPKCYF